MQKNGAQTSSHKPRLSPGHSQALETEDHATPSIFEIDLVATVLSVSRGEPQILVAHHERDGRTHWRLPVVTYRSEIGETLSEAVCGGIYDLTGVRLGYTEQLTSTLVSDRGVHDGETGAAGPRLDINYVALSGEKSNPHGIVRGRHSWMPLYSLFPWEDWRSGRPGIIRNIIEPHLERWTASAQEMEESRRNKVRICFGSCQGGWDEEKVSERLDLLVGAGSLDEALREHRQTRRPGKDDGGAHPADYDERHLRYVANALGYLRTRIKVEPLVFEMVPDRFTLYELQQMVEAILGPPLHKQNFRRLVEHMGLVEPTGEIKSHTGGRPAQLFRFRPSVVLEHVHPGMRVRGARL